MITINQKDALRAKVLPAGWQIIRVGEHYTKPSNTDGSTVHFYEMTVIAGQYEKVPLAEFTLSEKALGMGKNFFVASGQPLSQWEEAEKGTAITFDETIPCGKVMKAMVKPEAFGNRILNKATDFLALSPQEAAQFEGASV